MIKITQTLDTFEEVKNICWSGALDTLQTIEDAGKEDELLDLLSEYEWESETHLNDYLWFDTQNIFEFLGLNENGEPIEDEE